jgi:hypothetical protein
MALFLHIFICCQKQRSCFAFYQKKAKNIFNKCLFAKCAKAVRKNSTICFNLGNCTSHFLKINFN